MVKNLLSFSWEISKIIIFALLIVAPVRYFLFQPFIVKGASMESNFYSGDYLIIDEISYRFEKPERGDVIVFRYPKDPSQRFIKRIIGLPNETVEINNEEIIIQTTDGITQILDESKYLSSRPLLGMDTVKLNPNEYFVLGDNRQYSSDSRIWGPVDKKYIIGKVFLRVFPFSAFAKVEAPAY